MATRAQFAESFATNQRRAAAEVASVEFLKFCSEFAIEPSTDALLLHLTHLNTSGASGQRLRERLSLLNLAARLEGRQPWVGDRDVRRLLVGLGPERDGAVEPRALPLYRELVEALVDAIMTPTAAQLRWRAALLLANQTPSSTRSLALLRWQDVALSRDAVLIRWPAMLRRRKQRPPTRIARADAPEVHAAFVALKAATVDRTQAVFAATGGEADQHKLLRQLQGLPRSTESGHRAPALESSALDELVQTAMAPDARQLRDRALILLSYGAALTAHEATALRTSDVDASDRGVLLELPTRRCSPVGLARTDDAYCPLTAWTEWKARRTSTGLKHDDDLPAFTLAFGSHMYNAPMAYLSLLYVVRHRSHQAGLADRYGFSSLRAGWIRGALREGRPPHEITTHAGFRSVGSVDLHERRENILRSNVAAQLGL